MRNFTKLWRNLVPSKEKWGVKRAHSTLFRCRPSAKPLENAARSLVKWSFSFSFMVVLYKALRFPHLQRKHGGTELQACPSNTSSEPQTACGLCLSPHLHSVIKQDIQVSHCSVCPQVSYRTQAHSVSKFYFWDACKWNWGAFLACAGPTPTLSGPRTVQIFLVSKTPWAKILLYEGK